MEIWMIIVTYVTWVMAKLTVNKYFGPFSDQKIFRTITAQKWVKIFLTTTDQKMTKKYFGPLLTKKWLKNISDHYCPKMTKKYFGPLLTKKWIKNISDHYWPKTITIYRYGRFPIFSRWTQIEIKFCGKSNVFVHVKISILLSVANYKYY